MTRNASQRKDIRKYEKISAEREQARINFVVAAMSTSAGRAWFHDFLAKCQIFSANFANDPFSSGRIEGSRNIGLMLYADIVGNCPDYFVTMMKEATIQEQVYDGRTDSDPADELDGSSDGDGGDT